MLNSMPGYYPQLPAEEWTHQPQHGVNIPIPAPPFRRDSSSTSHSLSSRYSLVDENEELDEEEGEEGEDEVEEEFDQDSSPTQVESHAVVVHSGRKRRAYIRAGTIDVLEPSGPCSRWITAKFKKNLLKEVVTWGKMTLEQKTAILKSSRRVSSGKRVKRLLSE